MTEVEHVAWLKNASHSAIAKARDSGPFLRPFISVSIWRTAAYIPRFFPFTLSGLTRSCDVPPVSPRSVPSGPSAAASGLSPDASPDSARSFSTADHSSMSSASTAAVLASSPSRSTPRPSRKEWITSRASRSRPWMTSQRGDSGNADAPNAIASAGNIGAATIHRQLCSTPRKPQSTKPEVIMPKQTISSYTVTTDPRFALGAISPTYAGTATADAPTPMPTMNLPSETSAALLPTAMMNGPRRKNAAFHAMALRLPCSCITAPPTNVPKTAPSFAIPTMTSSDASDSRRSGSM